MNPNNLDALTSVTPSLLLASHMTTWNKRKRSTKTPSFPDPSPAGTHLSRTQTLRSMDFTTTTTTTKQKKQKNTPTVIAKYLSNTKGYGLYAATNIQRGQVLLSESPLLNLQTPLNNLCNHVCEKCNVPLGDLTLQTTRAATSSTVPVTCLPMIDGAGPVFSDARAIVPCPHNCGSFWCSDTCHASQEQVHNILCTQRNAANRAFYTHAIDQDHILLLVGRVVAEIIAVLQQDTSNDASRSDLYVKWWREYVHPLYWDIVPMRENKECGGNKSGEEEEEEEDEEDEEEEEEQPTPAMKEAHKQKLKATCAHSRELLLAAVRPIWPTLHTGMELEEFLSLDSFGEIAGMLATNTMEISISSPLQQYFEMLVRRSKRRKRMADKTKKKKGPNRRGGGGDGGGGGGGSSNTQQNDSIAFQPILCALGRSTLLWQEDPTLFDADATTEQDLDEFMPQIEGTGLYPMMSLLNHDCNPNTSVEFLADCNVVSLVATRDIHIHEELSITYVPTEGTIEERHDGLLEYGFLCQCHTCETEKKNKNKKGKT